MNYLISAMLVVVAIIHLLPIAGIVGGRHLASLYGIQVSDPNLAILMRHRAVLFGLIGSFFLFAAFNAELQAIAFVAGFISVISFIVLAWTTGDYNGEVRRIVIADVVALVCLCIGAAAYVTTIKAN